MHEYSVVQALLEQIETIASENDATEVTKIIVKIGVMSGVEAQLLEIAFNTFKEKTICDGAEFVMNIQPLTIVCRACHIKSELSARHYCCPECESIDVEITDGEDMFLMSLEMV